MEFKIEYNTIMAIAEEEVAREGTQAYSDDGVSLYDAVRMLSRDEAKKKRLMSETLVRIKEQCSRFVTEAEEADDLTEPTSAVISMDLSQRRAAGREKSIQTLLRSMTVNFFLNLYFVSKNMADLASKYDTLAATDVQMLNKILFTKLPPTYPA